MNGSFTQGPSGASGAAKARIRREILERRRRLSGEDARRLAEAAQRRLLSTEAYRGARLIALYSAHRGEVSTEIVFEEAVADGKEVCFPRVADTGEARRLEFCRVDHAGELEPGCYDILEPCQGRETDVSGFDLVVVPGVAFDTTGARVGYGEGYYDRVLPGLRATVAGLAFDFQVVASGIPVEDHDVRVDMIVTDERVYRASGGRGVGDGGEGTGRD